MRAYRAAKNSYRRVNRDQTSDRKPGPANRAHVEAENTIIIVGKKPASRNSLGINRLTFQKSGKIPISAALAYQAGADGMPLASRIGATATRHSRSPAELSLNCPALWKPWFRVGRTVRRSARLSWIHPRHKAAGADLNRIASAPTRITRHCPKTQLQTIAVSGGVVVSVPAVRGAAFDADKPDINSAIDGRIFAFAPRRQKLEDLAEIPVLIRFRAFALASGRDRFLPFALRKSGAQSWV